eukprot:TRINITY_DN51585_c0_g1_i1.p1 TRINITY_DN51585_c0_g1~~TRINITY_DN51585_c0_g1_i1.p1  ORF type:complete len:166 (+),score=28.20 TRINITY_DN51585_c0_g1_i1:64-498(+)
MERYTFTTRSCNSSKLWVNECEVMSNISPGQNWVEQSGDVDLHEGTYELRVHFYKAAGTEKPFLGVSYNTPGSARTWLSMEEEPGIETNSDYAATLPMPCLVEEQELTGNSHTPAASDASRRKKIGKEATVPDQSDHYYVALRP